MDTKNTGFTFKVGEPTEKELKEQLVIKKMKNLSFEIATLLDEMTIDDALIVLDWSKRLILTSTIVEKNRITKIL